MAVKESLEEQKGVIGKFQTIMQNLSFSFPTYRFYQATGLKSVQENQTSWISTFGGLLRHKRILSTYEKLELLKLEDLVLSTREENDVDALMT